MSDLNRVTLIGRLTRDAELKYTNSGLAICTFSIASNRRTKEGEAWKDVAHFFDITLFGKLIEAMKEDVADRSTPTEEEERAERGEREMELARDMERCQ